MKKILVLIILCSLMVDFCDAQGLIFRSSTGINLSKFTGHKSFSENHSYFASPFLSFEINKPIKNYFNIKLGIEYSIKGTNWDYYGYYQDSRNYLRYFGFMRLHYIIIPIGLSKDFKRLTFSYNLYTGKKLSGYTESLAEIYTAGSITSQTIASGKLIKSDYNNLLFGYEVGIGYKFNDGIVKISFVKDLISIDNLNSGRILNSSFRLSYYLTLGKKTIKNAKT